MEANSSKRFAEVWGDTVVLKELFYSAVLGIVLTMAGYILGTRYFSSIESIDAGLAKGYALMVGILGCILAGIISAKLFKPKRVVEEKFEQEDIKTVLAAAGMTLEEEVQALATVDADIIEELKDLNLTMLLELKDTESKTNLPKGGGLDVTD